MREGQKMKKELELYLHIPFCVKKCAYCDFLSSICDDDTRQRYVEALCREICVRAEEFRNYTVTTVFMGGGTPSILTSEQIEKIFTTLHSCFDIQKEAEITIEVNPGTVNDEKIEAWKQAGINRISIGLQTVEDKELKMLGRIHTYREFLYTWQSIRKAGFRNVNIDLISAIPGQTVESWKKTLRVVAELNPEHISAYSLIIEEGTLFYELYGEDNLKKEERPKFYPSLPDEEADREMYEQTEKILREYGYHRYEISNYAKKDWECKHNTGYWERKEYLGLGLGAASLINNIRFTNTSNLQQYIDENWEYQNKEILTKEEEMSEFMFLGLRMCKGVRNNNFFQQFGISMDDIYGKELRELQKQGLLTEKQGNVKLTKKGYDVSNYVFTFFI